MSPQTCFKTFVSSRLSTSCLLRPFSAYVRRRLYVTMCCILDHTSFLKNVMKIVINILFTLFTKFGDLPWVTWWILAQLRYYTVMKNTWKKQPLYCKPIWTLSLFMEGFMWIGVSAFWTANCHHWNPFECIVLCLPCTLLSNRLFECLIQIWGHRIEEGKKAFLSPLRPVGHPARVNKQAGGTLLPSGGQWFPSKQRKSHKGSF